MYTLQDNFEAFPVKGLPQNKQFCYNSKLGWQVGVNVFFQHRISFQNPIPHNQKEEQE